VGVLQEIIEGCAELGAPPSLDAFRRGLPAAWIEEALAATGTATLRRRRLPAEQVVWLVVGMALFKDRSIADVVNKLDLALGGGQVTVAPSAITQARARLGSEPLRWLFEQCGTRWASESAGEHRWRGLALYGVDGTCLRVPDSDSNREHFGLQSSGRAPNGSGYPLVRAVTLMALRSHMIRAVRFGPFAAGEHHYARELWADIPDDTLTVLDRGFQAWNVLVPLREGGHNRHWLMRARKDTNGKVIRHLGPNDTLVRFKITTPTRRKDPSLPTHWQARCIRYQHRGGQEQILLTSLLDPVEYPAAELVALYHERWEIEMSFDELKADMLERHVPIRSQTPEGVRQELWGIFIAYNLVRREMEHVARDAGVSPLRISFIAAYRHIRDEFLWCAIASPGAIPRHLRRLRQHLAIYVLPPRRSQRAYPRQRKRRMSQYPPNLRRSAGKILN
jgi:hypothetical protein